MRLRHYGLHASGNVGTKLVQARELLEADAPPAGANEVAIGAAESPGRARDRRPAKEPWWATVLRHTGVDVLACPRCKTGRLVRAALLPSLLARSPPEAS